MQVGQSGSGKATGVSGGREVLDVAAPEVPHFGCYAASEGGGRKDGPPGLGCAATIRRRACRIRARLFARRPVLPVSMDWRSLSGDVVVQLFWQGMYDELQRKEHRIVLGQHRLCDIIDLVDRGQPEGSNPWTPEKPTCVGHPCGGSQVQGAQGSGSPFFIGVTSDGCTQQQESGAEAGASRGKAGSPESISGGLFPARGDVEGEGCAQQNRGLIGLTEVYPERISGETHVIQELFEGDGSGASGYSESIPETLSAEEQMWMSCNGVQMIDPANIMSYEEFVRMQQECDSGSEMSMEQSEDRMSSNVLPETISGEAVEFSEMD